MFPMLFMIAMLFLLFMFHIFILSSIFMIHPMFSIHTMITNLSMLSMYDMLYMFFIFSGNVSFSSYPIAVMYCPALYDSLKLPCIPFSGNVYDLRICCLMSNMVISVFMFAIRSMYFLSSMCLNPTLVNMHQTHSIHIILYMQYIFIIFLMSCMPLKIHALLFPFIHELFFMLTMLFMLSPSVGIPRPPGRITQSVHPGCFSEIQNETIAVRFLSN